MEISFEYMTYRYMMVSDKQDFLKTTLPEISKLRSLFSSCSNLFKVSQSNISLAISKNEGNKVYRLGVAAKDGIICVLYYIPADGRLDIYDSDPNFPLISWKRKRCIWKNYSRLLQVLGIEKLFQPLVANI